MLAYRLEFALERAVEDGREQGVEFGGGFGLQTLERIHFSLQRVQLGHNPALLGERWEWYVKLSNSLETQIRLNTTTNSI